MGRWDTVEGIEMLKARLEAERPELVLLALGAPRQELLAQSIKASVSGPIICCGAAVEILGGLRPRAPRWVQAIGLEWAFRMLLEPRRLGPRYAAAARAFVGVIGREIVSGRR
jgi:exopolysaccharide biosynthesis WecB/TagA/CpsF family protein